MTTTTPEHAVASDSLVTISMNLMFAALLSGLIVATLNFFTQPIRERNETEFREMARAAVLPLASRFEAIEGFAEGHEWFRGYDEQGNMVGYVLPAKRRGYEGHLEMMLGVDDSLAITEFKLIKHRETPGLGAKAVEQEFHDRFKGRTAEQLEVSKKVAEGKILAITGATITSKAIADAFAERLGELEMLAAVDFQNIPPELANPKGHR
jgi:electron transport complex protein RnfG